MGDGQPHSRLITVVDLDGTLVRCNTLRVYLRLGLQMAPWYRRVGIAALLIARRLRLISHERMKYPALRLAGQSPELRERFVAEVKLQINSDVISFIQQRQQAGDEILIATAAAAFYVPWICDYSYVASPWGGPDLRGERKACRVARMLSESNSGIYAVLTDNSSDLPLCRLAREQGAEVLLVNPNPHSARTFSRASFTTKL